MRIKYQKDGKITKKRDTKEKEGKLVVIMCVIFIVAVGTYGC